MKNKITFLEILFFALYIILPSYLALEISSNLPLITGSRILLFFLMLYIIFRDKGRIKLRIFQDNKTKIFFVGYFCLKLISNLYYITTTNEAIKDIFIMVLEELLVLWVVVRVIDTKEKLEKTLKILVISSGIVAILSIVGTLIGKNIFYYLNTVNREMLMANFSRLGIIRAEAGFGHPVYYAVYCLIMVIISMYFIENNRKNKMYYIIFVLNIIALVLSNSRGTIIIFIAMMIYMFLQKGNEKINKYIGIIILGIFVFAITCIICPRILTFISNIWVSLTNVFSSNQVEISNYGTNLSGLKSRVSQFSQVQYALSENPIFGLGVSAHTRGVLKWFDPYHSAWDISKTFDVGYFAIICQYGVVGTIAYGLLYYSILRKIFNKRLKKDDIMQLFKYCFIAYFLSLLSISGITKLFWIILGLLVSYNNILINDKRS